MFMALAFLAGMQAEPFSLSDLEVTLAPEAAWGAVDWVRLRKDFKEYNPTSMVDFPDPYIARVKLSGDTTLKGQTVVGEGTVLQDVRFLTLTYSPRRGWRVWGIGNSVKADQILFPKGTFS